MKSGLVVSVATFVLGCAVSAHAATITETIAFTASNFFSSTAPIDPVTGSFTVTFDPAVADTMFEPATLNSLNIPGVDSAGPSISFYEGSGSIEIKAGDFSIGPYFTLELFASPAVLDGHGSGSFADEPGDDLAAYDLNPAVDGVQLSTTGTFTVTSGVPEPATWAMMLTGFGGLGAVLRSRRRLSDAIA